MQQDRPLRSLIIYRKLGRIMEYLISVSVGLLWNAIKEDLNLTLNLKSASRVSLKFIRLLRVVFSSQQRRVRFNQKSF